jgi:hypothetical protein
MARTNNSSIFTGALSETAPVDYSPAIVQAAHMAALLCQRCMLGMWDVILM